MPIADEPRAAPKLAAAVSVPILPAAVPPAPPAAKPSGHALSVGSTDPIKPVPVKTLVVKLAPPKHAPAAKPAAAPVQAEPVAAKPAPLQTASRWARCSTRSRLRRNPAPAKTQAAAAPAASPPAPRPGILGVLPAAAAAAGKAIVPTASAAETKPAIARSGWAIQIGAFEDGGRGQGAPERRADQGRRRPQEGRPLHRAHHQGRKDLLPRALRRLRPRPGRSACKQLKRSDIVCIAMKI